MKTKGRMTKKKAAVMQKFDASIADIIKREVGGWPLTAGDLAHLIDGFEENETEDSRLSKIRAMRRTLETLVRDGYLVHEVSESYFEFSTQRTMHRKGVAYDLPHFLRVGRPEGSERYSEEYREAVKDNSPAIPVIEDEKATSLCEFGV
ncbi:hypothetical protein A4L30_10670 [Salmonella enterica subsp. enterica serovar Bovismorbificans]|nr:hypothetical protein [Salmonella enterica subsp. enterica serovar Bovismorbificans]